MRFIVYNATPISGTTHSVLRWGDAPEADIGIQAGAGEVAIAAPAGWPANPNATDGGYTYNTASGAVTFVAAPYSEPYSDKEARTLAEVREALRESQWALLPDSWLNSDQKAQMTEWRTWVRALPACGPNWAEVTYNLTPPYSEF